MHHELLFEMTSLSLPPPPHSFLHQSHLQVAVVRPYKQIHTFMQETTYCRRSLTWICECCFSSFLLEVIMDAWLRYCWGSKTKKKTKTKHDPQWKSRSPSVPAQKEKRSSLATLPGNWCGPNSWILNSKALLSQNTNCVICVPSTWFVTTKTMQKNKQNIFIILILRVNSDTVLYFAYGW